ncbi:hypothetical protein BC629DRAFT_1438590 [Irpex lacteus]|nr:hypothetical protein BC629DRAFT_1438590 [Irpex lacteus]
MRSFTATFTVFLAVTSALAAPLNSTLHFFGKRDAVCGLDFRALVNKGDCIPTGVKFALTPPSTIAKVTLTGDELKTGPATGQCDHLVELQLLDSVAQRSGICNIMVALVAADSAQSKAKLLDKASADISAVKNLNFLEATVNNRKKTVIQRSLKGTNQESTDLDKAVGNFFQLVGADGTSVAGTLDADLAAIKSTAAAVLAKLPDGKSSRDKATVVKKNLDTAIKAFDSSITVAGEIRYTMLLHGMCQSNISTAFAKIGISAMSQRGSCVVQLSGGPYAYFDLVVPLPLHLVPHVHVYSITRAVSNREPILDELRRISSHQSYLTPELIRRLLPLASDRDEL